MNYLRDSLRDSRIGAFFSNWRARYSKPVDQEVHSVRTRESIDPQFAKALHEYFNSEAAQRSFNSSDVTNFGWIAQQFHRQFLVPLGMFFGNFKKIWDEVDWLGGSADAAAGGRTYNFTTLSGLSNREVFIAPFSVFEIDETKHLMTQLTTIYNAEIEQLAQKIVALISAQATSGWKDVEAYIEVSAKSEVDVNTAQPFIHLLSVGQADSNAPEYITGVITAAALRRAYSLVLEQSDSADISRGDAVLFLTPLGPKEGWHTEESTPYHTPSNYSYDVQRKNMFWKWLLALAENDAVGTYNTKFPAIALVSDLDRGKEYLPGLVHLIKACDAAQQRFSKIHTNFVYPLLITNSHNSKEALNPAKNNWRSAEEVVLPPITEEQWATLFGYPWMSEGLLHELHLVTGGDMRVSMQMASVFYEIDETFTKRHEWDHIPLGVLSNWFKQYLLYKNPNFEFRDHEQNYNRAMQDLLFLVTSANDDGKLENGWERYVFPEDVFSDSDMRQENINDLMRTFAALIAWNRAGYRGDERASSIDCSGTFDPVAFRLLRLMANKGFVVYQPAFVMRNIHISSREWCAYCGSGIEDMNNCSQCGAPTNQPVRVADDVVIYDRSYRALMESNVENPTQTE